MLASMLHHASSCAQSVLPLIDSLNLSTHVTRTSAMDESMTNMNGTGIPTSAHSTKARRTTGTLLSLKPSYFADGWTHTRSGLPARSGQRARAESCDVMTSPMYVFSLDCSMRSRIFEDLPEFVGGAGRLGGADAESELAAVSMRAMPKLAVRSAEACTRMASASRVTKAPSSASAD